MMVLVTYDISTETESGARRLHRVAKLCLRYGVRVQCSVFECQISAAQYTELKHRLQSEIDIEQDSVRFYRLGDNASSKVEVIGTSRGIDTTDTLIM